MTPDFTTHQVPDDDAHWNTLARRVAASAAVGARERDRGAVGWLAGTRAALVAASIVVAVAVTLLATSSGRREQTPASGLEAILLPESDQIGQTLAREHQAPSVGALLFGAR